MSGIRGFHAPSSNSSILSYFRKNANAFSSSAASPSTPPTSDPDVSSISSEATSKPQPHENQDLAVDAQNSRDSAIEMDNERFSASSRRPSVRKSVLGVHGIESGDALINSEQEEGVESDIMYDSIQVLDLDWEVNALPTGRPGKQPQAHAKVYRQQSKSSDTATTDSDLVGRTASILGRRSRETTASILEKERGPQRRKSVRSEFTTEEETEEEGDTEVDDEDEDADSLIAPAPKKARFSEEDGEIMALLEEDATPKKQRAAPKPRKPRVYKTKAYLPPNPFRRKTWLSQGLYVGQDPDFDPRLTETKNRIKKASMGALPSRQRTMMPMPMFSGARMLEKGRDFRLPFDVCAPLPSGQPKPEEWKKISKNVFIGDAAKEWKIIKHNEASFCVCQPGSGCADNCFNRMLFYECDDTNCNLGADECTNRAFAELQKRTKHGNGFDIGVEPMRTADRGYGVRSNRTFAPNQIIVEYSGEIITQEECENRMRTTYKDSECYYLMTFSQKMIIDATRGSVARFVNHSCDPNCKMMMWTVAGKPRVALFAGERGISTGEELTYDYNFNPFSSDNIQTCRCGATACRGVIGPKSVERPPPKAKELKEALEPILNQGTKRKMAQAISDTVTAVTKKRKLNIPQSVKSAVSSAVNATASLPATSLSSAATNSTASSSTNTTTRAPPSRTARNATPEIPKKPNWKGWTLVPIQAFEEENAAKMSAKDEEREARRLRRLQAQGPEADAAEAGTVSTKSKKTHTEVEFSTKRLSLADKRLVIENVDKEKGKGAWGPGRTGSLRGGLPKSDGRKSLPGRVGAPEPSERASPEEDEVAHSAPVTPAKKKKGKVGGARPGAGRPRKHPIVEKEKGDTIRVANGA